jgi:hypothetical protein
MVDVVAGQLRGAERRMNAGARINAGRLDDISGGEWKPAQVSCGRTPMSSDSMNRAKKKVRPVHLPDRQAARDSVAALVSGL